jgi:hypothetical protein
VTLIFDLSLYWQAAIVSAKMAYQICEEIFASDPFRKLALRVFVSSSCSVPAPTTRTYAKAKKTEKSTQAGNNNAYCQDSETSWYDLQYQELHKEIFRFTCGLCASRRAHPILRKEQFYTDAENHWFGPQGGLPNYTDPKAEQFACLIHEDYQAALCLMFNASADAVDFRLAPYRPGIGGIWPPIPLVKRYKICSPPARNRFGKIHKLTHLRSRSSAILLARRTNGQKGPTALTEAK